MENYTFGVPVDDNYDLSLLDNVDLLARLIYAEASVEKPIGQIAVGMVVRNRRFSDGFPDTVTDVILQANQFESVGNTNFRRPDTNSSAWNDCLYIAQHLDNYENPIAGRTFFMAEGGGRFKELQQINELQFIGETWDGGKFTDGLKVYYGSTHIFFTAKYY